MNEIIPLGDPPAIIQPAINVESVAAELDRLLAAIKEGQSVLDAARRVVDDWRLAAGTMFLKVRKMMPLKGPHSKQWTQFVEARGLSLTTAANYMRMAEHVLAHPDTAHMSVRDIYVELGIIKKIGEGLPEPRAEKVSKNTFGKGSLRPTPLAALNESSQRSEETRAEDVALRGPTSQRPSLGITPEVVEALKDKPLPPKRGHVEDDPADEQDEPDVDVLASRTSAAVNELIESWPKANYATLAEILRNALKRIER